MAATARLLKMTEEVEEREEEEEEEEEEEVFLLNQQPDTSSISFFTVLILSNLCVISMMSYLLYMHSRDSNGDPSPEDTPGSSFIAPSGSTFYVLPRLESVQVDHKQEVRLIPNKIHFMKTLSLKPPVFEIPDFLTEDECKFFIHLAELAGLNTSQPSFPKLKANSQKMQDMDQMDIFNQQDHNKDGKLQVIEMMTHLLTVNGLWLTPEDIQEMYAVLKLDPDGNGVLSLEEFKEVNLQDVYIYMEKKTNKSESMRNSQQVWLSHSKGAHPVIKSIQQRVIRLTRLPAEIVKHSEDLQVVRYDQGGYYHAHWDSSPVNPDIGCVHTAIFRGSQIPSTCRYATVLFYLNNVTGGGETTFPIADNATYDYVSLIQNNIDLRDTCRHCDKGNLRIKPVQGTAVFWYNFVPDEKGWAGDVDPYSLHGGCLVNEGTKWIVNNWINVDPNLWRQFLFLNVPYANSVD